MTESIQRGPGNLTLNLLRIFAAFGFMQHGWQKMFGVLGREQAVTDYLSLVGVAGLLETFGGALLFVGLFTRPVAFLLAGQMAYAYIFVHWMGNSFWPVVNRGEAAMLYCFIFLLIAAVGPGNFSLDALRKRRSAVGR